MIAVSGLDMAAWDALAKAAGLPLCSLLGGSVGPVPAYNSNGLWLNAPEKVASEALQLCDEGEFTALKLRLGRDQPRDDMATIAACRSASHWASTLTRLPFGRAISIPPALLSPGCRDRGRSGGGSIGGVAFPVSPNTPSGTNSTDPAGPTAAAAAAFQAERQLYSRLSDTRCRRATSFTLPPSASLRWSIFAVAQPVQQSRRRTHRPPYGATEGVSS